MDRRKFLITSAQLGIATGLSQLISLPAWAQPGPKSKFKNLITVHINDGWDVLLGLDPKTKNSTISDTALFIGYREDEIIRCGDLAFGPSAAVLKELYGQCIVINGVSMMGNISHPDSTRLSQTGIVDRQTAQLVSMKAFKDSQNGDDANIIASGSSSAIELGPLDVNVKEYTRVSQYLGTEQSTDNYFEPNGFVAKSIRTENRINKKTSEFFEKHPEFKTLLESRTNSPSGEDTLDMVLALRLGIGKAAHLTIRPQSQTLDTHSNHKSIHMKAQAECWAKIAELVKNLKSVPSSDGASTLYDETLIMVTSEFSRETTLNGNNVETAGKEHNGYTNSYLILGGRVNGGYSIGESVIQQNILGRPTAHVARNFDIANSKVVRTRQDNPEFMAAKGIKKQIQPGHIIRTLASELDCEDVLDPILKALPKLKLRL